MRIQNNIMAMNTHRQLGINNLNQAKSTEKLSSGYRINRAADDAAGLSISEKMRAQIRGLNMASANAQDGISLVQAAEGALQETHSILQRMRELAVKAANDVNESEDRGAIKKELDQLSAEIDRIAYTTEFNKKTLLDGSLGSSKFGRIMTGTNVSSVEIADPSAANAAYSVAVTTAGKALTESFTVAGTWADGSFKISNAAGTGSVATGISIATSANDTNATVAARIAETLNNNADFASAFEAVSSGDKLTITAKDVKLYASGFVIADNATPSGVTSLAPAVSDKGADAAVTVNGAVGTLVGNQVQLEANKAYAYISDLTKISSAVINVAQGKNLTLQVGANTGSTQTIGVGIDALSGNALGIDKLDVSSHELSQAAIANVENAIAKVSDQRSALGAVQNRLEHTVANLDTVSENLQAAESRIRDVDMAKEMLNFTKNNILTQAATAMLAQANQAPQTVLQLLR